jgi:hypothetical protein
MTQKAKAGGTPAMVPLGYLNVREMVEGREVRTVTIDPERGPLIREAFELYATGEWTLRTLLDHLTGRSLRSRATRKRGPQPLSLSRLGAILRSRYYIGYVYYRGAEYCGRHEAARQRGAVRSGPGDARPAQRSRRTAAHPPPLPQGGAELRALRFPGLLCAGGRPRWRVRLLLLPGPAQQAHRLPAAVHCSPPWSRPPSPTTTSTSNSATTWSWG